MRVMLFFCKVRGEAEKLQERVHTDVEDPVADSLKLFSSWKVTKFEDHWCRREGEQMD